MDGVLEHQVFIIGSEDTSGRLDVFLASNLMGVSRSMAQKLIEDGLVLVNGGFVKKNYKTVENDRIEVTIPQPEALEAVAQNIPVHIVYEDEDLVVVDKPKGMVVHPAAGNPDGTLVNALLYHCKDSLSGIGGKLRPGIIHRIDKDTSGLLMVAKNDNAHLELARQLKEHSIEREYVGVVHGRFHQESGTVEQPIGRSNADRKKMAVTSYNSRHAVTHYHLLTQFNQYAYMRFLLETGRTHQIRVHMAYINHPLAGDLVYGPKKMTKAEEQLAGQCLHARRLGFTHPRTGERMSFESSLPDYFEKFIFFLHNGS